MWVVEWSVVCSLFFVEVYMDMVILVMNDIIVFKCFYDCNYNVCCFIENVIFCGMDDKERMVFVGVDLNLGSNGVIEKSEVDFMEIVLGWVEFMNCF